MRVSTAHHGHVAVNRLRIHATVQVSVPPLCTVAGAPIETRATWRDDRVLALFFRGILLECVEAGWHFPILERPLQGSATI